MPITTENLIVVSNRLPFVLERNKTTGALSRKASVGGLVTAVAPISSKEDKDNPTSSLKSSQIVPVKIEPDAYNIYYNECCNGALWPLFHSMPDKAVFSEDAWEVYMRVNQAFADKTLDVIREMLHKNPKASPLVWIHDYHLMLAA
ncbi:Alpha_alphatrehalosephosphate synthase A-like, partial [Caligus rogercresseyi]